MSYTPRLLPRHLLLSSDDMEGYLITPRAMYHRAAARTLKAYRLPQVECLDQLYFQVTRTHTHAHTRTHTHTHTHTHTYACDCSERERHREREGEKERLCMLLCTIWGTV